MPVHPDSRSVGKSVSKPVITPYQSVTALPQVWCKSLSFMPLMIWPDLFRSLQNVENRSTA